MNPLSFGFMQRGLVAVAIVGAVAPLVGAFVVQRRQSLIGDGMGHVAFAGVGLALLTGLDPRLGALALSLVAAIALHRLQRSGIGGDIALALVFYGGIAAGFLFAAKSQSLSPVLGLLFGSPLNLTWSEVGAVALLAVVVVAAVALLYGPLLALAFDEQIAKLAGLPTNALALSLTVVIALVVVGAMDALGLLLVSAMMIVPVVTAARIASSYRRTLFTASAVGCGTSIGGLLIAFYADLAPGAAIVVTAITVYAAVGTIENILARKRKGRA